MFVIMSLMLAVAFRWNHWCHALPMRLLNNAIRIIAFISQQVLSLKTFYEFICNCAIRLGTRSNKDSYWQTMRIHGQVYFCVKPPFVRPIA